MIQIDDTIISLDVFKEKFLCNLDACKGECCIEGRCWCAIRRVRGRTTKESPSGYLEGPFS